MKRIVSRDFSPLTLSVRKPPPRKAEKCRRKGKGRKGQTGGVLYIYICKYSVIGGIFLLPRIFPSCFMKIELFATLTAGAGPGR